MLPAVQVALDYVYGVLGAEPGARLLIEQRVQFPSAYAPDDVWGTLDIGIWSTDGKRLWVADYKHGAGIVVDIVENRQLIQYAASLVLGSYGSVLPEVITLVIVQPRAFGSDPIREWTIDLETLLDRAYRLEMEIKACLEPSPLLVPGEKQCRFCGARPGCPAIERKALAVAGEAFKGVKDLKTVALPAPSSFGPERIADILAVRDLAIDWFTAVSEYAAAQAKAGVVIPGWKLVAGNSRRRWDQAPEVTAGNIIALSDGALTEDDVRPRGLVGLGDAERLLKTAYAAKHPSLKAKEVAEKVTTDMAFLTVKEASSSVSLVPASDRRPEVRATVDAFKSVVAIPSEVKE